MLSNVARGLNRSLLSQSKHTGAFSVVLSRNLSLGGPEEPPSKPDIDLRNISPDQVRKIGERYTELKRSHHALKLDIPEGSLDPNTKTVDPDLVRRKRLVYRSKQRGWLEVDLLLGSWAAANVHTLSKLEMDQYEIILNKETIDIYNIIAGIGATPVELEGPMLERLRKYAFDRPFGLASPEGYAEMKTKAGLSN